MAKIIAFLKGKKAYITAVAAILAAAAAYLNGAIGIKELLEAIFAGIGMITLRAGIAKSK